MTPQTRVDLDERLSFHGVSVGAEEGERLATYYDLLYKWNARINLTALSPGRAAIDKLLVEPVLACRWLPREANHLDIGSGGGSPALPILALRPDFRTVLVESRTKKAAFLREAARAMGLDGVVVLGKRLEEVGASGDPFSVVTVRAVRIDEALMSHVERLSAAGASLWYFGGPDQASVVPGRRWNLFKSYELLPEKQSRAMCFTWNSPPGA